MFNIIIFFSIVVQPCFVLSTDFGNHEYRASLITTSDDSMLVGQTIHKRKTTDIFDCALCLVGDQCKSFNFNEATGDCYLNGKRAQDKELVQTYSFIYGEKWNPCQNGGEPSIHHDSQGYQCKCKEGFAGKNCTKQQVNKCDGVIPAGMESGKIPDSSITASSQHDQSYSPAKARINNGGCWIPRNPDSKPWLQVDLGKTFMITAIAIQGDSIYGNYVKTYQVQYDITAIKEASPYAEAKKIITGNTDKNSIVKHTFNPSFDARYVRVLPQSWQSWIGLRIELYVGC